MRDSEAVVTPFMQVATYATRNFAHTIPIFRSGMDFLFIQFLRTIMYAHMRYTLCASTYIYPSLCCDSTLDTQRKVSEDPKAQWIIIVRNFAFLRINQSLALYNIQVSRFPQQRFWFPADCPISCIFTVHKAHISQSTMIMCVYT